MSGTGTRRSNGKLYLYYSCPGKKKDYARTCDSPSFRADRVDATVWQWIKSFLVDPETLRRGLRGIQTEQERENAPIRERLAVVDDLLTQRREEYERLLDLYLAGEFPKAVLIEQDQT